MSKLIKEKDLIVVETDSVPAAVAVLVINEGKLLLGKRIRKTEFEGWQCPGGYLLKGESPVDAARRLCSQKAGIEISDIRQGPYTNNFFSTSLPIKQSVTLYLIAQKYSVESREVFEKQSTCWSWYKIDELPETLFLPLTLLIEQNELAQLIRV